ncbi:MAG: ferredoxin [Myxococcota bacterium]
MPYTVQIDKQSCRSAGRCVRAAPEAFGFDGDHLAEPLPGAATLSEARLLEIARSCPAYAIQVFDAQGREIDLDA